MTKQPAKVAFALAVLGAILVGGASPARAHQGQTAGTYPFIRDGELVGGATTWGIVFKEGGGFERVCEEAVGATPKFHRRRSNGNVIVGTPQGLFVTADKGCTYASLGSGEMDMEWVSSMAVAERDPDVLIFATATVGEENGAWRSDDGGETLVELPVQMADRVFTSLVIDEGGDAFFLGGFNSGVQLPAVVYSPDGTTFTTRTFEGYVRVTVFAMEEGMAVAELRLPLGGSDFVLIDDKLEINTVIESFADPVSDYARVGDDRYVSLSRNWLHVSRDGGPFEEIVDGPTGCLYAFEEGPALWGCGFLRHFGHFLALQPDDSFEVFVPFGEVTERVCPEGTAGDIACRFTPPILPDGGLVVDEPDAGPPSDGGGNVDPPPDCGCHAGMSGETVALGFVLLMPLVGRRRRGSRREANQL